MNDSVITNNQTSTNGAATTAAGGAGFYQSAGTTTLNNTRVTNNTSAVTGSTAATPPSPGGGGIWVAGGTFNLNSSIVTGNVATSAQSSSFGGGMITSGATTVVNVTNSTFSNNIAAVTAGTGSAVSGGIDHEGGTLTMTASTVSGNTGDFGAGIRVVSPSVGTVADINRSAIVNNTASRGAGGVYAVSGGSGSSTVNLNNSTVSGNTAKESGGGIVAAAVNAGNAVVNINFSTVAGNTADTDGTGGGEGGGGIANRVKLRQGKPEPAPSICKAPSSAITPRPAAARPTFSASSHRKTTTTLKTPRAAHLHPGSAT